MQYPQRTILQSESRKRSLVKAVTWRITVIIIETIILYLLTHEPITTATFVGIKNMIMFCLYFVHERGWNRIHWEKITREM